MKQKKILTLTLSQLKQLYKQELPALISIAQNSPNEEKFKIQLNAFIDTIPTNNTQETIKMLIDYDGKSIFELSTGQNIQIKTISLIISISHRKFKRRRNSNRFIHRSIFSI